MIEREKFSDKTLRYLGWEVICLLQELEGHATHNAGLVELSPTDETPGIKFEIRYPA